MAFLVLLGKRFAADIHCESDWGLITRSGADKVASVTLSSADPTYSDPLCVSTQVSALVSFWNLADHQHSA